jgi:hypothetical protein
VKRGSGLKSNEGLTSSGGLRQAGKLTKKKMKQQADSLLTEADLVFSRWVRQFWANREGLVKCYTCEVILPWKSMQCGHFASRSQLWARFNENNARPQCPTCNVTKRGNLEVYENRLIAEIGKEGVDKLKQTSLGLKVDKSYLEAVIEKYKNYERNFSK